MRAVSFIRTLTFADRFMTGPFVKRVMSELGLNKKFTVILDIMAFLVG